MKQFRLPALTDRTSLDYFPLMCLVILDGVQICYLYGQSVLGVMVAERVVYTQHISNHLGNNLSTEFFFRGHT